MRKFFFVVVEALFWGGLAGIGTLLLCAVLSRMPRLAKVLYAVLWIAVVLVVLLALDQGVLYKLLG